MSQSPDKNLEAEVQRNKSKGKVEDTSTKETPGVSIAPTIGAATGKVGTPNAELPGKPTGKTQGEDVGHL